MTQIADKTVSDIITVKNKAELYKVIDNINLFYFLGLSNDLGETLFNCILPDHKDNNPSAHIKIMDNDIQMYKCFGCGFTGGILKLVQKIAHCTVPQSINFVKSVFNIKLEYSDWQKNQLDMLESNKDYLLSGKMEYEYPKLYKRIKNKIGRLIILTEIAKKNLYDETVNSNGNAVFFMSLTNLMKAFHIRSKDSVNNDITLFALLNLIEKLSEENIPINLLNKGKHIAAKNKFKKISNYYTIRSYDYDSLSNSEDIADMLIRNNFTMRGLSKEYILRTFGEQFCNKIFPQYKFENRKGTSVRSNNRTDDIVKVIFMLINRKGYAIEKEIIEILRSKYGKQLVGTQIKKSIQEILDSYDLQRVRANKELKNKYEITSKGYPFLIVKNK